MPETVALARHAVLEALDDQGTPYPRCPDVALAVSEAVTNVIRHAYDETDGGLVRMALARSAVDFVIEVSDDGRGMRPSSPSKGLGLGLPLMARLSDGFEVEHRRAGGTSVRIRFRCP